MKATRKWLALLITAVLVAGVLAACGDSGSGSGSSADPAASDSPSGAESSPSGSQDVVEIEFFSIKPEAAECYEELIKQFNEENPGIVVTLTSTPDSQKVFLSRVSTNDVPDVSHVFTTAVYKELMNEGIFQDLTGDPLLDKVENAIIDMAEIDGQVFCIPVNVSPAGIYYNIDLFAEQELTPPETYDQLIELCKALQAADIQPFAFSDKDSHTLGQQSERLLAGNISADWEELFRKVAAEETSFTAEPELRRLAEIVLELRDYGPFDNLGMSHEQAISEFVNQNVAMIYSGTWAVSTIQTGNPTFQYEMIPFPSIDGMEPLLSVSGDVCYAISSSSSEEKQAAAYRFIEFLLQPEIMEIYIETDPTPNMTIGINYDVPQLAKINDIMATGRICDLPSVLQPAGFRVDWQVEVQQLLVDGDIDAFLQKSDALTRDYYSR